MIQIALGYILNLKPTWSKKVFVVQTSNGYAQFLGGLLRWCHALPALTFLEKHSKG